MMAGYFSPKRIFNRARWPGAPWVATNWAPSGAHGSYVAPDWSADWLHRELMAWLEIQAQDQFGQAYETLSEARQGGLQAELKADVRRNRYNPDNGTITISNTRFDAINPGSGALPFPVQ